MPLPSLTPNNPWPNRAYDPKRLVGRGDLSRRMNEAVDAIGNIDRVLSETADQSHSASMPDIFAEGGLLHDPGGEGLRAFDAVALDPFRDDPIRSQFQSLGDITRQMGDLRYATALNQYGGGGFKMKQASRDLQVGAQGVEPMSDKIQRNLAAWHDNPEKERRYDRRDRRAQLTKLGLSSEINTRIDLFHPHFSSSHAADVDALNYQESVLGHRRVAHGYGGNVYDEEEG